jgi:adenosylhomocysteine nucleosidase
LGDVAPPLLVVCGLAAEARIAKGPRNWTLCAGRVTAAEEQALAAALSAGGAGVLSFGIAGGLAAGLKPGDIVLADSVVSEDDRFACDSAWLQRLAAQLPTAKRAPLFGAAAPVATTEDKLRLATRTGAVAVDMESQIAAGWARHYGAPLAVLRIVADSVERTLPPAALVGMRPDGSTDIGAVLRSLAAAPGQMPALIRTALDAKRAFDGLKRCRRVLGDGFCLLG